MTNIEKATSLLNDIKIVASDESLDCVQDAIEILDGFEVQSVDVQLIELETLEAILTMLKEDM